MTKLPSCVTTAVASPKMTERYVHVNSAEVVQLMEREGYRVAAVRTASPRARDPLYARHSIDFRHANAKEIAGATPRILFTNSHDGTTSAQVMAGFYRFVCSNGLVIGETVGALRQRHSGDAAYELITRMRQLAKNTEKLYTKIDGWTRKELTLDQQINFAQLAAQLRWGDAHMYGADQVLRVRRAEDDAANLWSVFNRIQENTIRGGLIGLSRSGRQATSRPLTDIGRDAAYNAALWTLAEEVAANC